MADGVIGQNVGDLVNREGVMADIKFAIDQIVTLDSKIKETNENGIHLSIDTKGVQNLNSFADVVGRVNTQIESYNELGRQNIQVATKMSAINNRLGVDMGQALLHYADTTQQIYKNNAALAENANAMNSATAQLEKLKSLGVTSGAVVNELTNKFNAASAAITPFIVNNKLLATEITKTNQIISGAVADRVAKEEILEQKSAIVNKNMLDKKAANAADLLQKQEAFGDAYNALLLKQAEAEEKSAIKTAVTNAQKEANAADLLIKQNAYGDAYIALLEQESIAEQIAAIKNKNSLDAKTARETRAFNVAWEQGEKWQAQQAKNANSAIASVEKQTIGYQMLAKAKNMALRFPALLAELAIFALLFAAIEKIGTAFMESIPGTDAFIAKQEKMTQATDALKSAFSELGDALIKYQEQQRQSLAYQSDYTIKTLEDLKRIEDATKRKGEVDANGNNAANAQHVAAENRRKESIKSLQGQIDTYEQLKDVMESNQASAGKISGKELVSDVQNRFKDVSLPAGFLDKITADIEKNIKDKGSMSAAIQSAIDEYTSKIFTLHNQREDVSSESGNDINAQHNAAYDKRIELEKTLASLHQQLREANAKEDIESVDKVVGEIQAKYVLAAQEIEKQRARYIADYTGDKNDKEYLRYLAATAQQLAYLKEINEQNKKNAAFEQTAKDYSSYSATQSTLAQGNADIANGNSAFGSLNYGKSAAAMDADTQAKKAALTNQFQQLASTIKDSSQIIEAEQQLNDKLKQVDQQAYKDRLGLANQYFQSIAARITTGTEALSNENERRHYDNMTHIIKGRGNTNTGLFNEDIENQRADANIRLQDANKQIPAAQEAFGKTDAATKGPLSPEAQNEADAELAKSKKNLEALYTQQSKANYDLVDLDKQVLDKKKEAWKTFYDALPEYAQQAMSAIQQLQQQQFAVEQQNLEIKQREVELQSTQQIADINAEAGFAITKNNEVAKVEAQTTAEQNKLQQQQNQLELKQAEANKKNAEANILLSTAAAIMKIWEGYADQGEVGAVLAAAQTAAVAAIGAVQYAAAAAVPLPVFGDGGVTDTWHFIAGERGENELITPPSGQSYWSGTQAKIFTEQPGTLITPVSKMIDYAASNITGPVKWEREDNAQQQFNGMMMKFLAEKYEDVGDNIVNAIVGTASRPVNPGKEYDNAVNRNYRLQSRSK